MSTTNNGDLPTMNVLDEVQSDLRAVTVDDIKRAKRHLDPIQDGERELCKIQSEVALRLWALALKYARRSSLSLHTAHFDAADKEGERELLRDSTRLMGMSTIAREAAWLEIREEAGVSAYAEASVGLREGFVLVAVPEKEGMQEHAHGEDPPAIAIPLPGGLAKAARAFFKDVQDRARQAREQQADNERPAGQDREHGPS